MGIALLQREQLQIGIKYIENPQYVWESFISKSSVSLHCRKFRFYKKTSKSLPFQRQKIVHEIWSAAKRAYISIPFSELARVNDRKRKTNTVWYHLYAESKKYNKLVNITKKKQTHRYREQASGYQWGEGKGEGEI